MGKKKRSEKPMPAPAPSPAKKQPTQAKLELPPEEFEEVRRIAKQTGRSLVAFIRIAVQREVKRIKEGKNG
jgi:hypothetical protein